MTEASDTMLVAATGGADAFWRASTRYLSILVDVLLQPGRRQVRPKWRKWRKILLEWGKFLSEWRNFLSEWRKLLYIPGRIGAATSRPYLVAFRRDTRNVHYVACSTLKCDFGTENVAE